MSSRRFALLLLLLCIACKPVVKKPPARQAAAVPRVRATVVTIETTMQPSKKTFTHELVIANGRARTTGDVDVWRLFDLSHDSVTFVDDIAKTYRTEPVGSLVATRKAALDKPLPAEIPRAEFVSTGARKTLQGVEAAQSVIKVGGYTRELWIGSHPAIPPQLFAAMQASTAPSTPIAGMTRIADEALASLRGFPLADHSELPVGNAKLIVDRTVTKIEQRDVPAALLEIPRGFKDLTAPAARPRSAS